MKRSEVTTLIQNELAKNCGAMKFPIPVSELCDKILRVIEEVGMLPPTIIKERLVSNVKSVDKAARSLTISSAYEIGPTNEWEPE